MTDDMMNLRNFVEKTSDADLLREMIGFAEERLMKLEVGATTGAAYGEKGTTRLARRNGYRDRDWEVRWAENDPGDRFPAERLARLSCASRSCARAPTFPVSLSTAA